MTGQEPKKMTIKTDKSVHYDRSYSVMYASQYGGRISRKNKREKLSGTSITGNKITQYQENISKEAKVGSSIEGKQNPSVLTPPPYKNKQDYKGGKNDNTHDSHTHETSVSRSDDDSLARNLDAENKNTEYDE